MARRDLRPRNSVPPNRQLQRLTAATATGAVLLATALASANDTALAKEPPRATLHTQLAVGAEGWVGNNNLFHGWVIAALQLEARRSRTGITFNTDTIELRTDVRASHRLTVNARVRGQLGYANLLPDAFFEGERRNSNALQASTVEVGAGAWLWTGGLHTLGLEATTKFWTFHKTSTTSPDLVIPDEQWHVFPRLIWVLWDTASTGLNDLHRTSLRIEGLVAGFEAGFVWRSEDEAWGLTYTRPAFAPEPRNAPSALAPTTRAWLRSGTRIGESVRLDVRIDANALPGADDLTRARVGSMTPWYTQAPGMPWAVAVSEYAAGASLEVRLHPGSALETGPLLAAAVFNDPLRDNSNDWGAIGSAGWVLNWQHRGFVFDSRYAVAPLAPWPQRFPSMALLVSGGWSGETGQRRAD